MCGGPSGASAAHNKHSHWERIGAAMPGTQARGAHRVQGKVVEGFQRGSKQLGVPTANVAPTAVAHHFAGRPQGVYFGWAQLQLPSRAASGAGGGTCASAVAPMVLNYGVRPTMKDGSHATVLFMCPSCTGTLSAFVSQPMQSLSVLLRIGPLMARRTCKHPANRRRDCVHGAVLCTGHRPHSYLYCIARRRPRAATSSTAGMQIEAHIMHSYEADFYGKQLKLVVVGYLRPEMSFAGFQELVDQIHADIGQAKAQLAQLDAHTEAQAGWWSQG